MDKYGFNNTMGRRASLLLLSLQLLCLDSNLPLRAYTSDPIQETYLSKFQRFNSD